MFCVIFHWFYNGFIAKDEISRQQQRETGMVLQSRRYLLGEVIVDEGRSCLVLHSGQVSLRLKAMKMLIYLIENQHRTCSNEELMNAIWGQDSDAGKQGINNLVWSLRQILSVEPGCAGYIETIPKRGYRLCCVAEQID